MNSHHNKIENFTKFKENSKVLFQQLADNDENHQSFTSYPFRIAPGGREGGRNTKLIEVFYGKKAISGSMKENDGTTILKNAHGVTLSYLQLDNGDIMCTLYPAGSDNFKQLENFIILDYLTNTFQLEKKAKQHWKSFIAYMEYTAIDTSPKLWHKYKVWLLKHFKEVLYDNKVQEAQYKAFIKQLITYVMTVGLSGFLLIMFTFFYDSSKEQSNISNEKIQKYMSQLNNDFDDISNNIKVLIDIEKKLLSINQLIKDNLESQKAIENNNTKSLNNNFDNLSNNIQALIDIETKIKNQLMKGSAEKQKNIKDNRE